jgi:hypothetical protein
MWERDWHTRYLGSCPLGGGSLRPVYDHRLVFTWSRRGRVELCLSIRACNMMCPSRRVPLVALYMQPVRVYKGFLVFYSKSACWAYDWTNRRLGRAHSRWARLRTSQSSSAIRLHRYTPIGISPTPPLPHDKKRSRDQPIVLCTFLQPIGEQTIVMECCLVLL